MEIICGLKLTLARHSWQNNAIPNSRQKNTDTEMHARPGIIHKYGIAGVSTDSFAFSGVASMCLVQIKLV